MTEDLAPGAGAAPAATPDGAARTSAFRLELAITLVLAAATMLAALVVSIGIARAVNDGIGLRAPPAPPQVITLQQPPSLPRERG